MKLLGMIAGTLLATASTGAVAAVIVVRSSGPSAGQYPTGKSLADTSRLLLKGGDTVILLDAKGSRTLKGPGSFPAASIAGKSSATSFAALVGSSSARRGRVGAVRPPPQPRQLWQASSDLNETFCFVQPNSILVRREDVAKRAAIVVRDLASGKAASVNFEPGVQLQSWPTAVPVSDGGRYRIGTGETVLRQINPGEGFADMGSALIRAGCNAQLDVLSTTTALAQ